MDKNPFEEPVTVQYLPGTLRRKIRDSVTRGDRQCSIDILVLEDFPFRCQLDIVEEMVWVASQNGYQATIVGAKEEKLVNRPDGRHMRIDVNLNPSLLWKLKQKVFPYERDKCL